MKLKEELTTKDNLILKLRTDIDAKVTQIETLEKEVFAF